MSFNFIGSQIGGFLPSLLFNGRVVFPSMNRSALKTIQTVQKYKCRNLIAAPKLLFEIFDFVESEAHHDLASLHCITASSQFVAAELVDRFFERFDNFQCFTIAYGQTEVLLTNINLINQVEKNCRRGPSFPVGRALPFVEQKVVDMITKAIVPKNTSGELYTKSFSVFNGYWKDAEKTNEAIDQDGWFKKLNEKVLFSLISFFSKI